MSILQADVDALESAIYSGVLEVEYTDKRIRYRSMKDMLTALAMMKNSINGTVGKSVRLYDRFDKGL